MKTKNLMALLLCLALCLAGATAMAELERITYDEADIAKAKEWADTLDTKTYDDHLKIELASEMLNDTSDYNKGDVQSQWFTEHFNFEWDMIAIPDANSNDKVRTMINSGDVPDVLRWNTFDINEINSYIDQELFYKLPEDWRERWPNIAHTQDLVPVAKALEEKNGGTYALFRVVMYHYYPSDTVVSHNSVYLREDWAKEVGFEIKDAYTASELLEFARLIKEKDPGKVGAQLIPLNGNTEYLSSLFLSSSYPNYSSIYKAEDGQYRWGFADEETLAGLKLWKQAYDEGLLSPEFYTYSEADASNAFRISGTTGAVILPGSICWDVRNGLKDELGLGDDAWHQAAIVGEDGYYHDMASDNFWGATYFSADIDEAVFERYMDIVDFAVSDAGADLRCDGFQYIDWVIDENGEKVTAYDMEQFQRASDSCAWPVYTLLGACGDDNGFNTNPANKGESGMFYANQLLSVYNAKLSRLTEGSIIERDWDSYGFNSDKQTALTAIDYKSLCANLVVAQGDLETNWKNVIADNAYLVDPTVEELNETFGGK
ncbi:MAG: extracellular solute-binding protein [Clostridia bacterium]|nr:extracellular solute-binding protein [Clostridia bacterium]